MKISIIGAGNGGQAMAGHFAMLGHYVCLYNRSQNRLNSIQVHKIIDLSEAITGKGYLSIVTTNLEEAINGAELIMVTTTADAHCELAEKMAPFLSDDQIVVLNPGRTLGALEFGSIVRRISSKRIYIAEAQSLIYACRAELPGYVRIIGVKEKVLLAAFPCKDTDYVLSKLNSVYPCFVKGENTLHTSLENIGAILHPAVILFNAAIIERGQEFYFYNDMTPAIAAFIEQLDYERIMIGKVFGLNLIPVKDWVSYAYSDIQGADLCEKMKNNPAYHKILAPSTLYSRLLLEDIPTGILPLTEIAKVGNVPTPLMVSLLSISQALLKIDFSTNGRTLKNLELENFSVEEFKQYF